MDKKAKSREMAELHLQQRNFFLEQINKLETTFLLGFAAIVSALVYVGSHNSFRLPIPILNISDFFYIGAIILLIATLAWLAGIASGRGYMYIDQVALHDRRIRDNLAEFSIRRVPVRSRFFKAFRYDFIKFHAFFIVMIDGIFLIILALLAADILVSICMIIVSICLIFS